jgi:outer membrane protein TolC
VQISVPVFNGGQRDAQVKAADARVDEARIAYAARIRQALSEVNQALIQLNSSLDTLQQLQVRQQAASLTMQSTLDRQRQGMASQLEIEEARRQLALSQLEQIQARLERNRAWLDCTAPSAAASAIHPATVNTAATSAPHRHPETNGIRPS